MIPDATTVIDRMDTGHTFMGHRVFLETSDLRDVLRFRQHVKEAHPYLFQPDTPEPREAPL